MTTPEQVYAEIRQILVQTFGLTAERISPGTRLMDDLDLDSLDAIDLTVQIEQSFGLAPKGSDLRRLATVQDIVDFIVAHQEPAAPRAAQPGAEQQ